MPLPALSLTDEQTAAILTLFGDEDAYLEWQRTALRSEVERRAARTAADTANAEVGTRSRVLIHRDTLTVLRPSEATDEHGWATGSLTEQIGQWRGTLQWALSQPLSGPGGPFDPDVQRNGTAYLPIEAGVREGDVIVSALSPEPAAVVTSARMVFDPFSDDLDCIEAVVAEYVTGGDAP